MAYIFRSVKDQHFRYSGGRHLGFVVKDLLPLNMTICSPTAFRKSHQSASPYLLCFLSYMTTKVA